MLLLAASFGLAWLSDSQSLVKQDMQVWDTAKKSLVTLLRNGIPCGQAALIDKSGLFLASQSVVLSAFDSLQKQGSPGKMQARLSDGRTIILDWKATDDPTQTVLLQAENWVPEEGAVITLHPPGETLEKVPVLVIMPSGPVRGWLIGNRVGVLSVNQNRVGRMFPLGEVRFEASTESVGGALVFDTDAHLIGLLNATLATDAARSFVKINGPKSGSVPPIGLGGKVSPGGRGGGSQAGPGQGGLGGDGAKSSQALEAYGPADTTTGYTVGPEVLRRIVSGFRSPNHRVPHPAIGITCKDGPTPGALILSIRPGSPADKAGIQPGDTIVRMDDKPIRDQFDFARAIEAEDPGDSLTIVVMRDLIAHTFKLTVGTIQKAVMEPVEAVRAVGDL